MHGCDSIGCLSLSVRKLGDGVKVYCKKVGSTLLVALTCIGAVASVNVGKIGDSLRVDATRLCSDVHLSVHSSKPMVVTASWTGGISVGVTDASNPMVVNAYGMVPGLRASAAPMSTKLQMQAKKATGKLRVTCGIICSVNITRTKWMWDAGEILLWDNSEIVSI